MMKVLALIVLFLITPVSGAEVLVPPFRSYVTDLTGTISAGDTARLEQKLAAFEKKRGSQIAVLIIPTTLPETIEQFSIRVVDTWKPGRKKVDDGVLLLVAKEDRTVRIEVGYGLEGALPDAIAKRIIEETIIPGFRKGDFAGAIDAGVEQILRVAEGEPLLPPVHRNQGVAMPGDFSMDMLIPVLLAVFIGGKVLQSVLGRFAGAAVMSGITGWIVWAMTTSVAITLLLAVVVFFINLFGSVGAGVTRGGRNWPGGGWGGGGGFGGGGFGGGGGGGFGGGGASGRW